MNANENAKLIGKLYWLQFDVYTQIAMGNDDPIQYMDIEMIDGSTRRITITSRIAKDVSYDNPFNYRMFYEDHGYQQVAWEHTKYAAK